MEINFEKYQGTGNDFVVIDNRNLQFDKSRIDQIQFICSRKFGIGSDGLILIENHEELDFHMYFFNPDGSQSFCGNGSRCAVQYAYNKSIITSKKTTFLSTDGMHEAEVLPNSEIKLKMNDVDAVKQLENGCFMNTGSPHVVQFVDNLDELNIIEEGQLIRYSDQYKSMNGTNVNFVSIQEDNYSIRTYERGVENETLSCGTGVTACALGIANKLNVTKGEFLIHTKGGKLKVAFEAQNDAVFSNIWLSGAATFVFNGTINLKN